MNASADFSAMTAGFRGQHPLYLPMCSCVIGEERGICADGIGICMKSESASAANRIAECGGKAPDKTSGHLCAVMVLMDHLCSMCGKTGIGLTKK